MRKWMILALVLIFTGCFHGLFAAENNKASVDVSVGYSFVGTNDESTKVAEYETTRSSATTEIKGKANIGLFEVEGYGLYRDRDDKTWAVDMDFGRVFRINYDYMSFIHRLQHDYLYKDEPRVPKAFPPNNVSGLVAMNPFWRTDPELYFAGAQMLAATDLDPGKDYQIVRSEQKISVNMQLPFFPYLTFKAMAKKEREFGWRQHTLMTGKCTPCHIVGTSRRINQFTRDFVLGGTLKYGIVTVDYSHLWRHFDNQAGQPRITFDYVLAPEAETDMFRRRLLYDSEYDYDLFFSTREFVPTNVERLPYAEIPDIGKTTDKLKVKVDLPYRTTLFGYFVYSDVKNSYIDKDYDTTVYGLRLTTRPLRNLTLSLRTKYYTIDNDDVKVKLENYSNDDAFDSIYQKWGAVDASYFDYVRKSNLDRDVWEAGADVKYTLSNYYVRVGYKYTYINRDHEVWKDYLHNDLVNGLLDESFLKDDTTKIHDFKVTVGGRPINKLNFRVTYKYQHQQDPFMNRKAIGFKDNYYLPAPGGVPYYMVFRNHYREAHDGTNVPSDTHQIKLTADWTPVNKVVASLNLSYKYQKNDDADWDADTYVAGVNFLIMPAEKLTFNVGTNYEHDTYSARMCVDLFGG